MTNQVWVGFDPREVAAYDVCRSTIIEHNHAIEPLTLDLKELRRSDLYTRPTYRVDGHLYDMISAAPMSTEFAISRFLVPILAKASGADHALFMDCDMLVRTDLDELFALADDQYAVQVVKHQHKPTETTKMDGQVQMAYYRKNWSSVMLFNLHHPSNARLSIRDVNQWTGRDLHMLRWLSEEDIGELAGWWNHLVGVDAPDPNAKIVHFTLGVPSMPGYEACEFADEWREAHRRWIG